MVSAEGATSGGNIMLVKALKVICVLNKRPLLVKFNIVLASHKNYADLSVQQFLYSLSNWCSKSKGR